MSGSVILTTISLAFTAAAGVAPAAASGTPAATGTTAHAVSSDRRAPAASASVTPCSDMATIASCVMNILSPANGTHGVYLQHDGQVLASANASFAYEPASSIKPLIALYALTQVEKRSVKLTTQIPMINGSGGPDDCPPNSFSGTEPLATALQQMLQVSDNNRTDELMQYFGVGNLNTFAASLGLTSTKFQTSTSPPGFDVIGCLSYGFHPLPATVDGNTMSVADAATLWGDIAALPAPYAATFDDLAAGRDMYNTEGSDFTGVWPTLESIAQEEAPSSLSSTAVQIFIDHMTVAVKGGSYQVVDCTSICQQATWWVFSGTAEVPTCRADGTMTEASYNWGYFINDATESGNQSADNTVAGTAFFNASGQLLAAPIAKGLKSWSRCASFVTPAPLLTANSLSSSANIGVGTALGTVTDNDVTEIPSDMAVSINWGDRTAVTYAAITGRGGSFVVRGWHHYAAPGTYPTTLKLTDEETGVSTSAPGAITVH